MEIWKFEIPQNTTGMVNMPSGAEIISVDTQRDPGGNEHIAVWAIVDPLARYVGRRFEIVGTGQTVYVGYLKKFVGTVFIGSYVWHIFDAGEEEIAVSIDSFADSTGADNEH